MNNIKLKQLKQLGQSPWFDTIQRKLIADGTLKKMINQGLITGITSNPTIFDNAISGSNDYDEALRIILKITPTINTKALYEMLAIQDIQSAADFLFTTYKNSNHLDGYVSLEVSPTLARDTVGTIEEAQRLYCEVNRPNVMIKVPATKEGLPAITELISQGISVNATLLFSLADYDAVASAYIRGLEKADQAGKELTTIASVASFFVSRIDTAVDNLLPQDSTLRGTIAIANAKLAYKHMQHIFETPRFMILQKKGAQIQRLLWASTGTKNKAYSDTLYVDALIGNNTVNTMPQATLEAFQDHGQIEERLSQDLAKADQQLQDCRELGINLDDITEIVQQEGVLSFAKSFENLIASLTKKADQFREELKVR